MGGGEFIAEQLKKYCFCLGMYRLIVGSWKFGDFILNQHISARSRSRGPSIFAVSLSQPIPVKSYF